MRALQDLYIEEMKRRIKKIESAIKKFEMYKRMCTGKWDEKKELNIEGAKAYLIGDILNQSSSKGHNREFFKCPLHNEKTASFVWYKGDNSWHCFGCGEFGDSIDLYQKLHDVDFKSAVKALI